MDNCYKYCIKLYWFTVGLTRADVLLWETLSSDEMSGGTGRSWCVWEFSDYKSPPATTASTATAASWTCGHSANEILRETANINSFRWDVKKLWNFHTMTSSQRSLYKKCKYVINTFWQFHDLRIFDILLLSIVIFLLLCTSVGFSGLMT